MEMHWSSDFSCLVVSLLLLAVHRITLCSNSSYVPKWQQKRVGYTEANRESDCPPIVFDLTWGLLAYSFRSPSFWNHCRFSFPVMGMTGFVFKGLPFLMNRSEKGRFWEMANWPVEAFLGRNHSRQILFDCFFFLFPVCMMTNLSVLTSVL